MSSATSSTLEPAPSEAQEAARPIHPVYLPLPYQDAVEQGRILLRDGTAATLRPATIADHELLKAFFKRLSPESLQKRFFSALGPDDKMLDALSDSSNPLKSMTLIVTRLEGDEPQIAASASYITTDETSAEFAVAVLDSLQGLGLGSVLLERLAVIAASNGITKFNALTRSDNQPMMEIFRNSGFAIHESHEDGYVTVDFSVLPSEKSVEATEMRDRVFTTASLRPFFKPRSVAVIGASRTPSSIGYRILQGLVTSQFQGVVYPVNPKADHILCMRCYASLEEIPGPVDLAVVVVPRDHVLRVVDECGAKGVKALIVISAGFAETKGEGAKLQTKLLQKVQGHGMRMVGPNCLGLLNADPAVRLNASFSPIFPPSGRIAMSSQSGALGLSILALAKRLNLGLSSFVSMGNKADVSGNDLIQYWESDANTDVILLYLESFKNPRRFARLARRVSRTKPIICVKGGRTAAGGRAAGSHTAALAGSDVPVEALFSQTGMIRADKLEDMFDIASALASQPLPRGRRVAIVTNAGGPGILCTDACETSGLVVPEISDETRKHLATFLPSAASLTNPVDMIASAPPEHFEKTVQHILSADEIDAMIVIYIPVGVANDDEVIQAVGRGVNAARSTGGAGKPVLLCPMVEDGNVVPLVVGNETIPAYLFPEATAKVLQKMVEYAEWRNTPLGLVPDMDNTNPTRARQICMKAIRARGDGWLSAVETREVLQAYGLPVPKGGMARTADEAAKVATEVGFPVAVKLASETIVHKTDIGGVLLNLKSAEEVSKGFESIRAILREKGQDSAMDGVLIQPMLKGGVEIMIGVTEDPLFGPLIGFGLGGIHVEILKDVVFRVTPLTDRDAAQMVRGIKGSRLLKGYRGHPPADMKALEDVLLRISTMVEEIPEIYELDLNPIFAMEPGKGCWIVDARIGVKKATVNQPKRNPIPLNM